MDGARIVRLFVSAPGDVEAERLRVKSVAERLNDELPDAVRFEVLNSDGESYGSEKALQTQPAEPSECDIVIGILWTRLGTKLPATFPPMPNGEPYPSVTAYELLSAIGKRQKTEAIDRKPPDVYVFQKQPPPPPGDASDVVLLDLQWKLQRALIERSLRARDTRVPSGVHDFATTEDFETQIETLLRDWIASRVMIGRNDEIAPELPVIVETQATVVPDSAAVVLISAAAAPVVAAPRPSTAIVPTTAAPVRRRTRMTVIAAIAAMIFAGVAAAAVHNLRKSQKALDDAMTTISGLVEATSNVTQPDAQADNVDVLLEKARKAADNVAAWSSDLNIVQHRARILLNIAEINFDRGRIERVSEDASAAFASLEPLAKAGNLEARHMRAQAERLIGATFAEQNKNEEAIRHYEGGIVDLNELLNRESNTEITWRWMRSLADLYQALGDALLLRPGQTPKALEAYEKSRTLRIRLVDLGHKGPTFEHDLAWVTSKRGEVENSLGNDEAALKWFTEARDRLGALKDRIWDNPRWAMNFATVDNNIGLLKRRQNRFVDAAPIFAQAEDILTAAYRRDPKNIDRALALNLTRFIRTENLFRWAAVKNDRILMLDARERAKSVIETTSDVLKQAPQRPQAQIQKARAEALMNAIDGTLRLWNGNSESAAAGFLAAVDTIEENYIPHAQDMPLRDLIAEYVQYLEWTGMAYVRAQNSEDAQKLFRRADDAVRKYQVILGPALASEFSTRLHDRLEQPRQP